MENSLVSWELPFDQGSVTDILGQTNILSLSVADAWGGVQATGMFSVMLPLVDPVKRWETAVQGLHDLGITSR